MNKPTMTMREARLAGYEKYTVAMRSVSTDKEYTQNCYYNYLNNTLVWNDVVATFIEYCADESYSALITTEKGTEYEMLEMHYGHTNLRPADSYDRYMYITTTEDEVKSFRSNREYVQYHFANPKGAIAKYREARDLLFQYVEADHINSGWLISYDNDYHHEALSEAFSKKRVSNHEAYYHVRKCEEKREELFNKIAQVHLGEIDRAGQPIEDNNS